MTPKPEEQQEQPSNAGEEGGGGSATTPSEIYCRVVNKEGWNYDQDLEEFLECLPKVELHVHLDGSFDHAILYKYLTQQQQQQDDEKAYEIFPKRAVLPWDVNEVYPVRALVQNCKNARDFHRLCTCRWRNRQRYAQLYQQEHAEKTQEQPQSQASLQTMIKCFEIFLPLVRGNLPLLEQLAYDFVLRQWEQNVIYTEVRYAPHLLADGGAYASSKNEHEQEQGGEEDPVPVMDAITRGLRRGCHYCNHVLLPQQQQQQQQQTSTRQPITINQILCGISFRPEWSPALVQLAHERRNDFPCAIVGVDIAAGEEHFEHLDQNAASAGVNGHVSAFAKAKECNVPVTMHAGEVMPSTNQNTNNHNANEEDHVAGPAINIWKAIHVYNARRIGHGYRIVQDLSAMQKIRDLNVHFEVCPTSSVETGGWSRYVTSPVEDLQAGGGGGSDVGRSQDWQRRQDSTVSSASTSTSTTTTATTTTLTTSAAATTSDDDTTATTTTSTTTTPTLTKKPWSEHPLLQMLHQNLSVSLNSDDPAVFDTSLNFQYRVALSKMKVSKRDVLYMVKCSIEAAFVGQEEKKRLGQCVVEGLKGGGRWEDAEVFEEIFGLEG